MAAASAGVLRKSFGCGGGGVRDMKNLNNAEELLKLISTLEKEIEKLKEENGILQDQLDAHCEGCYFIKH